MAVNLSPYGGVGTQFFDNSGNVLTGGKIFTYAAGTTTPQVTYTNSTGGTPHSNPIILDAAGRVPSGGEIWLTDGLSYKFILRDANDVLIATYDNISGINSNFVAFTNQQEIQIATAGQTVFNLATMTYQPGTNNLSVFVDGVNQYGPGAQYAYLETDSDTVTFVNGLHVGAEVKFTTSQLNSSGLQADAFQVSYTPPFTGSIGTNVGAKLAQIVSVKDFGAVGDGITDDTANIQAAINYCASGSGHALYWPAGTYKVTNLTASGVVRWIGESKNTVNVTSTSSGNLLTAIKTGSGFAIDDIDLQISGMSFNSSSGHTACGHCLYIERYIRLVLEDVTIFGAGRSGIYMTECFVMRLNRIYGLFCGQNIGFTNEAVIQYSRVTTGNSFYLQNSYISNSIGTDGVKINTIQNASLSNVTLESCDKLINIGTAGTLSRSIRLETIYCENAAVSHIDLQGFVGASLENIYVNPAGAREATVERAIGIFDTYNNVLMRNISVLGAPGSGNTAWLSPYEFNVNIRGNVPTQYVGAGVEMQGCSLIDTITVNNLGIRTAVNTKTNHLGIVGIDLGITKTKSQLLSSADVSTWAVTGATVTTNTGAFYDGSNTYTVAGTTATNVGITTSATYLTGENLCFSTFAWGSGRILLRGRRTSDNVFEDVAEFVVSTDQIRRVWASALLAKDYNSFVCRIIPNTSVTVVYPQLEKAILPSNYA